MAAPEVKTISIVTPVYNEEKNLPEIYSRVKAVMDNLPSKGLRYQYRYEHLFIDNASLDQSAEILRGFVAADPNVRVILNSRNFGHIRSPFYGMLQASGDVVIWIVSDLQDPPEMIAQFLEKWEQGYKKVLAVKESAEESWLMFKVRSFYYKLVNRLAEADLQKNFTGFGLYDRRLVEILREIGDPYPYFRGLVSEIGFETCTLTYRQPKRTRGITSNNFYRLYDMAMLGITNQSKVPLRIATFLGFGLSAISLLIALGYFLAKLIFWNEFNLGTAPVVIGLFSFASIQLFFIGVLGEYIGSIQTQVLKRPLVIEKERLGFDQVVHKQPLPPIIEKQKPSSIPPFLTDPSGPSASL